VATSGNMSRSRRGRGDGKLYARAAPEKVEITENYSVEQTISDNPTIAAGLRAGHIEITVPYDGERYFSRQAADDVRWGGRTGNGQETAVIGHLLLADHAKTGDLGLAMLMHNNAGVIPVEVPVPASADRLDQLTSDRHTSVITYDYQPAVAEVCPVSVEVALYDPDTMLLQAVDQLAKWGELPLAETIDQLRRDNGFTSALELSITVRLSIPVKKIPGSNSYSIPTPSVKLVSIEWPTITSLSATQLERDTTEFEQGNGQNPNRPHPVRYNPILGRLEWEDIPMDRGAEPEGSPGMHVFGSVEMRLRIGHPGELFTTAERFTEQKLMVHAEVEVPGYLLSGLEAWYFDATGDWQRQPTAHGGADGLRPWQPKLTTRVGLDSRFYVADTFAKRDFRPYQQFVFDDVIPNDMRITDILNELRYQGFQADCREDPGNQENPDSPKWLLTAWRSKGPDTLFLLIAVEGEKSLEGSTWITEDNRTKRSGSVVAGRMRLSVLGTLPREHANLAREMSGLQQALWNRFRFKPTSRA
jgi:hypothetical protein